MIGQQITKKVTKKDGVDVMVPCDQNGNQLAESAYQPTPAVLELFSRCMRDYQVAYNLQHRPFDYFDGISLLERTRLDQQTFGAFVGAVYVPEQKRWKWKGRKNTARNKLIGIAAHMIAGILFPTVFAQDDQQKDQKLAAKVMRIQVEHHLRKAKYDVQFLFAVLSALACPAVFMQVEWIEAMQNVKMRLESGETTVMKAVDEMLSGLNLNIRPVDEIMLGDFYTFNVQRQPFIVDVRRISWDQARAEYAGKHFVSDPITGAQKDRFDYVQAGKTRVVLATQEKQVLYDIEWTEADRNFVQVLTFKYRAEDLEVLWVGGVFMGDEGESKDDIYALNPFTHRRIALAFDDKGNPQWGTAPAYNIAKSGFEPADPYGRFAYYKSGAFKEYWDDESINHAYRALQDGMTLDVYKPIMVSGISKVDGTVIAPHAVSALPGDAKVTAYSIGPNLAAAMNVLQQNESDIAESTIDKILEGQLGARQTALAVNAAITNAKIMLGLFGLLIADLVMQIGDLTVDCIVQHATIGQQLDDLVPGALGMKYKTYLAQSKEHGRDIVHRIVYTDKYFGEKLTPQQIRAREWELWENDGGAESKTHTWEVNPYLATRFRYQSFVDADQIVTRSIGGDKQMKQVGFEMLSDPRVAPYVDMETVVNDFVIEEYGGNDPDRYKKKGGADDQQNAMLKAIMGNTQGQETPETPGTPPAPKNKNGGAKPQGGASARGGGAVASSLPGMDMAIPHG